MSSDIVWQVLRHHNAHIVKRDGIIFSSEPGNVANIHSYKFSGLANKKVVHVGAGKDKKVHLITK
jgi:large subunit ribosomal protein L28e